MLVWGSTRLRPPQADHSVEHELFKYEGTKRIRFVSFMKFFKTNQAKYYKNEAKYFLKKGEKLVKIRPFFLNSSPFFDSFNLFSVSVISNKLEIPTSRLGEKENRDSE
jgi:hypothetical protein